MDIPKVIVFDWDGTIANTMPILTKIAVDLLTHHYQLDRDQAKQLYIETTGLPFVQQIALIFPKNTKNTLVVSEFEQKKENTFFDQALFPDVVTVFQAFKRVNVSIAVSSSTIQSSESSFNS